MRNLIGSRQGALAFLRGTSLGDKAAVRRELWRGWLPFRGEPARTVFAAENGWADLGAGVRRKELWSDGILASWFHRLEAGAAVPPHEHPREEECLILKGEVFLGDILLRAGEYQMAPAGSRHGEVSTDVGATRFLRGARDEGS